MTQTTELPMTETDSAAVRSRLYKLFALVFRYPTPGVYEELRSGKFPDEVCVHIASLPHLETLENECRKMEREVRKDLESVPFPEYETRFVQTFEVGAPAPPCAPYEGEYREGEARTAIMLEVSEFYRHFGLNMSQEEGKRELPDHLCAELEFLHFLTFKEAQAREEGNGELLQGYLLAQKDFLERHLVKWIPTFSEKLQKQADVPFYHELAAVTSQFVNAELSLVRSLLMDFDAGQA